MAYSLGLQAAYTHLDVGIFKDGQLLMSVEKDKALASKELIPLCALLLQENSLTLKNLSYIAVNQGPAPFTTLRTVISTAQGLAYATKLPLVGIDGLALFLQETQHQHTATDQIPVVVLHAFGNDVYYGYTQQDGTPFFGCLAVPTLIERLANNSATYFLVGNGALMHQALFKEALGNRVLIPEGGASYPTLTALGTKAWQDFQAGHTTSMVQPLYLKKTL